MRHVIIVALAGWVCFAAATCFGQKSAPGESPGLKVGQKAPAFTLKDQTGKDRSLDDLTDGAEYVALVFYRSASW